MKYFVTFAWTMTKSVEIEAPSFHDAESAATEFSDGLNPDTDGSYKEDSFETATIEEAAHA